MSEALTQREKGLMSEIGILRDELDAALARADRLEAQCAELSGLLVETSSWGHPPGLTVKEWQALLLRVAAAVTRWEASRGRA